jgi:hypothetical protein
MLGGGAAGSDLSRLRAGGSGAGSCVGVWAAVGRFGWGDSEVVLNSEEHGVDGLSWMWLGYGRGFGGA